MGLKGKTVESRAKVDREKGGLLHRIFEIGVIAKGVDGALELIGGILLLLLSRETIRRTAFFFVRGELEEDPGDLISNLVLHSARKVAEAKFYASAFLLVHGVVKLSLVAGLATNKLWSYPAAILVFTGFTICQLYELTLQRSLFLEIATILDVVVIVLVIAEYRHVRQARRHGS
jgi:uncharacterized membrane protein